MLNCINRPCCAKALGNYEDVKAFFLEEKAPFTLISGNEQGSRIRSKLAVRGSIDQPLIGLFFPGTHEVYEIPHCFLHHEKINEAVHFIKEWILRRKIVPYQEKEGRGLLRYIQCVVERKSARVQVSLVLNTKVDQISLDDMQDFVASCPPDFLHSLWINYHSEPGNLIFGRDWRRVFGKMWLEEEIAGTSVCYLPGSFGQANLDLFEKLVQSIQANTPAGKRIGEFYAGVGVIGLSLAEKASFVTLSESNPESLICFEEMRKKFSEKMKAKVSYRLSKTEEALEILKDVDIALVDPPRKGLDPRFIGALECSDVKSLIYVSCGFNSLVRDLKLLKQKGWKVEKAEGYPFFPGTLHLETLCFIERKV